MPKKGKHKNKTEEAHLNDWLSRKNNEVAWLIIMRNRKCSSRIGIVNEGGREGKGSALK